MTTFAAASPLSPVPTPAPDLPARITALSRMLSESTPAIRSGGQALRSADLEGPNWLDQFKAASAASSAHWKDAFASLKAIKAGAAQLGSDPVAISARELIDGAMNIANRGFDNMGRAYMNFWNGPSQNGAKALVSVVANQGDRIATTYDQTAAALRALATKPA